MERQLTEGRPFGVLLRYALPVLGGNLFQLFYTLADTVIIGKTLGADVLATVGSTGIISYFVLCFVQGLTGGFGICLGQCCGAGDETGMRRSAAVSWTLSAVFTLLLTPLVCLLARPVIGWVQTPEDIFADAYAYLFVILLGTGATVFYNIISYMLRALGGVITGSIGGFAGYAISNRIPESFYTADLRDGIGKTRAKKSGGKRGGNAAAAPDDGRRRTLVLDGANFSTTDGLFREFNRLFDVGPDEAVHSLDALNDLLGGGVGKIPAGARLHIRWLNSNKSREDLGYGATVLYYEKLLRRCHPNNRPRMEAMLAEARRGEGETLFEKLTALIARTDTGHDCTLSLE